MSGQLKNLPWPLHLLKRYLFGVIKNDIRHLYRNEGRRTRLETGGASPVLPESGAYDEAERVIAIETIGPMLDTLPRGEREVVVRCDLEGWRACDLARELGISPAAVRKRLSRARQKLRERFGDMGPM